MSTRLRLPAVLAAAWMLAACAAGSAPTRRELAASVRRDVGVCPDLAHAFRLVAERRDEGGSAREQHRDARESVATPFVRDPERALADWGRVIDSVYAAPELSPREIERSVLDHCDVDAQGRAVVRGPWGAATSP